MTVNVEGVSFEEQVFLEESNRIENVTDEDTLQQAIYAWKYLRDRKIVTMDVILKTQKILMLHSKLQPDQKGYLRKKNVIIRAREWSVDADFQPIIIYKVVKRFGPWEEVGKLLRKWIIRANKNPHLWWRHHKEFEAIHPFIDGNGRVGRMLMNWQRLQNQMPIKIITFEERDEYFKSL